MTPQFWLERWQSNAIGFHQGEVNGHLQKHWLDLTPVAGSTVLVPMCGKTLDMIWLRSQGHSVLGVELSPIAVRDFFAENELPHEVSDSGPFRQWSSDGLTLLEGDFFQLSRADVARVSHVFDRASLVALPREARVAYAHHLAELLPAEANVLLVAFEYDQSEMDGPPFAVHEDEVRRLYGPSFSIRRLRQQSALDEYPRFRALGLRDLSESIYLMEPMSSG